MGAAGDVDVLSYFASPLPSWGTLLGNAGLEGQLRSLQVNKTWAE